MPYAQTVENSRFVSEYRAEPRYAQTMTEDQYVAMRRVDEGLDPLQVGGQQPQPTATEPKADNWLASGLPADDGHADGGQPIGLNLSPAEVERLREGERQAELAGTGTAHLAGTTFSRFN